MDDQNQQEASPKRRRYSKEAVMTPTTERRLRSTRTVAVSKALTHSVH